MQDTILTFLPALLCVLFCLCAMCILTLLQQYKKISKRLAVLLALILIAVTSVYYFAVRLPQQQREARLEAARLHFATLPVYRTIKTQQPALYQTLLHEYLPAVASGESDTLAQANLRPMLSELLSQRISYASSEALNRYMQVSLEQMKVLRKENNELCFKFLFPQVSGGIDSSKTFPAALREREMMAIDYFLQHSHGAEQTGDADRYRADLQNIVRKLYGKWGSDLQIMNAPAEVGADKIKLCEMTIDLYQSVLALPANNSAGVLRIILDGNTR
ncbi:hypothetical protein EHW65_05135 [Erwinia psidii]|nr:hypothetical protein [Erwinia psidii]